MVASLSELTTTNAPAINSPLDERATISLRPYQLEAVAAVESAWQSGLSRLLIVLATGMGKTVIFSRHLQLEKGRSLVIAHRDELLEQAREKILMVHPKADIGMVRRKENNVDAQIVLASVQSIARDNRLQTLGKDFSLVVCDEAHHAVANFHKKIITHVGCFDQRADRPRLLGVTATPQRTDGVGLNNVFEKVVYKKSILDGIIGGFLVDLICKEIKVDIDLSSISQSGGDYDDGALGRAMTEANAVETMAAAYKEFALDRIGLAFLPVVQNAEDLVTVLNRDGIKAEVVKDTTPIKKRHEMYKRLETGETRLLANCGVLTEGFDAPHVSVICHGRPTISKSLYIQIVGRGTRPAIGKKDCLILDIVGSSRKHKLITLADITGLPAEIVSKDGVRAGIKAKFGIDSATDEIKDDEKKSFKFFATNSKLFSELHWIALPNKGYVLALGEAMILLYPLPEVRDERQPHFDVYIKEREKPVIRKTRNLTLDYAQGVAEDLIRYHEAYALAAPDASWRKKEPKAKQLELLEKFEIKVFADMTRGEAADKITKHIAMQVMATIRPEEHDAHSDQNVEQEGVD
jgi:superfamily II DNA or RNA helicase